MTDRTEYAVLRFLEQNGYCHIVNDFIKGSSIMQYVKEETVISKQTLFMWMAELAHQMEQYYKCEEERAYGYVNPYAVIITEEGVLLLDVDDQGNEEIVRRMQKKKIRVLFVRREYVLSQQMRAEDDWYGFGKMIQFMADRCCFDEKLTRKEERALRRITERCMSEKDAGVRRWKEVQKEFTRLKCMEEGRLRKVENNRKKGGAKQILLGAAMVVAAVAAVLTVLPAQENVGKSEVSDTVKAKEQGSRKQEEESLEEKSTGTEMDEIQEKNGEIYLEIGLLYFIDLEDYEKSCVYLKKAATVSELAECYLEIVENLQGGVAEKHREDETVDAEKELESELESLKEEDVTESKLEEVNELESLEEEDKTESVPEEANELESVLKKGESELEIWREAGIIQGNEWLYEMPFLYAYGQLGTEDGWKKVIETGERIRKQNEEEEIAKQTVIEKKLEICMAEAYENLQEISEAIKEYEKLKELETEQLEQETIYLKLDGLYEINEEKEKAWDICCEAVEKLPKSEKIRIMYIARQCSDSNVEREVCVAAIQKAVDELPELVENEEFKKLQTKYKIIIEGGKICVEE